MSIVSRFTDVTKRIAKCTITKAPRLVAVSKVQEDSDVMKVYDAGHRIFGESIVNNLVERANKFPKDIEWHLIGHLQNIPNVWIETVDSEKLAGKLQNACLKLSLKDLNVFVQVNTSNEPSKSGVSSHEQCLSLFKYIKQNCSLLNIKGLMTIGKPNASKESFNALIQYRKMIYENTNIKEGLELSMGMSNDFEEAIICGSTNVRIGTTIFGERKKKE